MVKNGICKKVVCMYLVFSTVMLSLVGCGGHQANPVDRYTIGDEKKSCTALKAEIASLEEEVVLRERKKSERDTWNLLEFIGGVLIIVPFFFMDAKGSYEVEIDALKARKKQLQIFMAEKNCSDAELVIEAENGAASQ